MTNQISEYNLFIYLFSLLSFLFLTFPKIQTKPKTYQKFQMDPIFSLPRNKNTTYMHSSQKSRELRCLLLEPTQEKEGYVSQRR